MIKIFVVCHDAGGSNILSSLIKKYRRNFEWIICISGPARNIFLTENIKANAVPAGLGRNRIDNLLDLAHPDFLLTGTSWGSDFETNFIKPAKRLKIKTASFLEHWGAYRERFGYPQKNWHENLPDFIFVGDKWAYKITLENGFSKDMLMQVENPYFEKIIKEIKSLKCNNAKNNLSNKNRILYLSEPICHHAVKQYNNPYHWGFTEYEVLKDLLKIIESRDKNLFLELKIRLHPSEKTNKYSTLINKEFRTVKKSIILSDPKNNSLINDCMQADIVIGSGTMALFIALLVGRKAICYMPVKKQAYSMPQKEIKKIFSFSGLKEELGHLRGSSFVNKNRFHKFLSGKSFQEAVHRILGVS